MTQRRHWNVNTRSRHHCNFWTFERGMNEVNIYILQLEPFLHGEHVWQMPNVIWWNRSKYEDNSLPKPKTQEASFVDAKSIHVSKKWLDFTHALMQNSSKLLTAASVTWQESGLARAGHELLYCCSDSAIVKDRVIGLDLCSSWM